MFSFWYKFQAQQKSRSGAFSSSVSAYVDHNKSHKLSRKRVEDCRFVVFDTETTGFDPQKDKILSIGAIAIKNGIVSPRESFEVFVRNRKLTKQSAVTIHEIIPRDLQDGLGEEEAVIQFLDFIKGDVLVAHHAAFDVTMVSQLTQHYFKFPLFNASLDTFYLARRLELNTANWYEFKPQEYTLDSLCKRYHIGNSARHNAAGDALATAELFQILVKKAQTRGIQTVSDLLRK